MRAALSKAQWMLSAPEKQVFLRFSSSIKSTLLSAHNTDKQQLTENLWQNMSLLVLEVIRENYRV